MGVRLIVVYKLGKAVLQACAAVGLAVGIRAGLTAWLTNLAVLLAEHAVHPWSMHLARLLIRAVTPGHIRIIALALAGDALVSAFEGWVLRRGYSWAPWVVVGATGSLLPLEVVELVRRPRVGRVALLVINAAIVVYLVVRAVRDREATPARLASSAPDAGA
jgi:uncharacterized membrane protein (DUF2068 family)